MEKLQYEFEMTFPVCDHKLKLVADSKRGAEKLYNTLTERYNGICAKCFNARK